jgi:hypothetical protein
MNATNRVGVRSGFGAMHRFVERRPGPVRMVRTAHAGATASRLRRALLVIVIAVLSGLAPVGLGRAAAPVLADDWATDPAASVPSFPGAQGFGSTTPGGRFGRIVEVTNLNDVTDPASPLYPGSFRWAIEHNWPEDPRDPHGRRRIVVFKVGGLISAVEVLQVRFPFTTIAGQTAPGGGIAIKGAPLRINTHDVVVRGMRFRVGDEDSGSSPPDRDGLDIGPGASNVVVDHNSFAWSLDEAVSLFETGPNITVSWNVIGEPLNCSRFQAIADGCHSSGVLVRGSAGRSSLEAGDHAP